MRKYEFKSNIKQESFQIKDFLGVDFTTHESEVSTKRSPDSVNMISGKNGSMDKRLGYAIEHLFDGRIWGMKIVKTYVYGTNIVDGMKERFEIDVLVVLAGTTLWGYNSYLDTWQKAKVGYTTGIDAVFKERQTNFISYSNISAYTLIHNNWITNSNDFLILFCSGSTYAGEEGTIWFYIMVNDSINTVVYIPTTSIGRSPDGKISTKYEGANLLVNFRKNKFLSNSTDKNFLLDCSEYSYAYEFSSYYVRQMQSDGKFSSALHDASGNPITYTFDNANRKVIFSAVPHATYITGVDNIEIWYLVGDSTKKYTNVMNSYLSYSNFGVKGSNDLIFFCDNKETRLRHKEIWARIASEPDDTSGIKRIYIDENNYSLLGFNRKIGYSQVGEYLVLHGEREGLNPVAYLKQVTLDADGELAITNTPTTSQVSTLASKGFGNLRDDPLFISESGVTAVLIDKFTNVQTMQERGNYIRKQLLEEPNLENAIAFVWDNKYFVSVNSHLYVADSRIKYAEKLSYSESFQYEWYYWDNIDIQCYDIIGETLYFGTTDGRLCHFKKETDEYAYYDEVITIETEWALGNEYSVNDIVSDGAVEPKYYVCIKAHTSSSTIGLDNEFYWNEVIKGIDRFYVPVLAYWTTPIMNMDNITVKKTLKNLWVRLPKYKETGVRIYYSTQGLIKERYDGIFDFGDIDFSRFTFSTDTDPMVVVTNRQERKFMSIQFKIESRDGTPMSLLEIVGKYTVNSAYKG